MPREEVNLVLKSVLVLQLKIMLDILKDIFANIFSEGLELQICRINEAKKVHSWKNII